MAILAACALLATTASATAAKPQKLTLADLTNRLEYSYTGSVPTPVSPPTSLTDGTTGLQLIADNVPARATAAWSTNVLSFADAKTLIASFSYTVSSTHGYGDGFAFVVQSSGNNTVGASGGCLGYSTMVNTYGDCGLAPAHPITTGFAVGLSTYALELRVGKLGGWAYVVGSTGLQSAHTVVVRLDKARGATTGTLSVTIDRVAVDLTGWSNSAIPWPGDSYVGFTAGTGGASETVTITNFAFTLR